MTRTTVLSVRMTPAEKAAIEAYARRLRRPPSQLARLILLDSVQAGREPEIRREAREPGE